MKKISFFIIIVSVVFLIAYYYIESKKIAIINEVNILVTNTVQKLGNTLMNQNPEKEDHFILSEADQNLDTIVGSWVFESHHKIENKDGQKNKTSTSDIFAPYSLPSFTIHFDTENNISGTTDCNTYTGLFEKDDVGNIHIPPFAITKMVCPDSQETRYYQLLNFVKNYYFDKGKMYLVGDGYELVYIPQ